MQPASHQPARQPNPVVRFGVFEADLRSGELRKNGVKVKIQDLPFRALKLLLSRPNEVLSRDQLRQSLWPEGVFVDFDHGISSAINRLRDALGDSADNPIFVETVERRGYRWIAPIHVPASPPQPGPVLIRPELEKAASEKTEAEKTQPTNPALRKRWRLALVVALVVLLVAAWSVRPIYRAARAGARKPVIISSRTPESSQHAPNGEAEQFYLKGRFYWEKRTPDGLNKAVDYFTQAIVQDPNYAPAYVGLADCYNLLREYTLMPSNEAYPRALAAAKKAVELDDQSSEAHASLAFALFYGTWNAPSAEREFRRSIDLNPNNAVAHHWYATYLSTVGQQAEAITEIERAQALDPASKSVLADKGNILLAAGHRDEATTLLKQLAAADPDFVSPHRYLKWAFFAGEDYIGFLVEWRKEILLLKDRPGLKLVEAAEQGYAAGGEQGMLKNMRTVQTKLYDQGLQTPYGLVGTNALLGNKAEALKYLKIAYEKRDENTVEIVGDPLLKNLHDDPAYKDIVARMGFPVQN